MPTIKQRLAAGELVRCFSLGRLIHPVVVDLFALAGGYHGFWLDQEHAGLTYEQIVLAAVCGRANQLDCLVRMPVTHYAAVTQNLEAGAGGVMAARVESVDEVERFVSYAKFAPRGTRGMNSSGRDGLYTHKSQRQFAEDANREQLVAVQIETAAALDDGAAIAGVSGVDLLFVGPSDLSQALGVLGQPHHPRVWEAVEHIARVCRDAGKPWGTFPLDAEYAHRAVDLGGRFLMLGADTICLRRGIDAVKETFAREFADG